MRVAFYCVANESFFHGAVGLVNSLRLVGHDEPIFVLDCGLTDAQRELLVPEVTLVVGPQGTPPTLLKAMVPLRHPAEVMVLIDTDMIVTRPLTPLIEQAAGGRLVTVKDLDRFVPQWGELLDLGPTRHRYPYISGGLLFLSGPVGRQVARLLDELRTEVDFELTWWGRATSLDYPFLYADQDILNAILATRLDRDQFVIVEKRLAAPYPFDGLRLLDEGALRCAYPDGSEPYVLHHTTSKPWLESLPSNVYSRLLTRLLFAPDVRLRLDPVDLPLRLRPGWAENEGASLEIAISQAPPNPKLAGCNLELPVTGARTDPRSLRISGWVLGEHSPAVAVEFEAANGELWRLRLDRPRPDLVQGFPGRPDAEQAGFETSISVLAAAPELEFRVRAVLGDHTRAPIATIRGHHRWRGSLRYAELVSVVIPCFNQSHFLGEAIESVLSQSYPNLEVVVIDDGSRDNTGEVARRYPGVRYLRQPNAGIAAARNAGIRETAGEFLVFLDADDRLLDHAIETGLSELEGRPDAACAVGASRNIGPDGQVLPGDKQPLVTDNHYERLLAECFIWAGSSIVHRRQAVEQVGGFNPERRAGDDYELYLNLARQFPMVSHDAVVTECRRHGSNMTRDTAVILTSESSVLNAQRQHLRNERERLAWHRGLRRVREEHGGSLLRQMRELQRAGETRLALRHLASAVKDLYVHR